MEWDGLIFAVAFFVWFMSIVDWRRFDELAREAARRDIDELARARRDIGH